MDKVIEHDFGAVCGFNDPIDCAMFDDSYLSNALDNINSKEIDEICKNEAYDDIIDASIDYSNVMHEATFEDMDADDYISAERDMTFDPLEDDEVLDAILGDEDDIPEDEEDFIDDDDEDEYY